MSSVVEEMKPTDIEETVAAVASAAATTLEVDLIFIFFYFISGEYIVDVIG